MTGEQDKKMNTNKQYIDISSPWEQYVFVNNNNDDSVGSVYEQSLNL